MAQLQSHQNHDPEWFGGIHPLINRLKVIDQYDVLHISAEIRFGISRRWEKGRSHKYDGVCWIDSVVRWDVAEKVKRPEEWMI